MLGTRVVRRWALVVAMAADPNTPDELIAVALQRARMCERMGGARRPEDRDALFTIGLFSVADALLGAPMEEVLATLPFSKEIEAALLRHEGPKGEVLAAVHRLRARPLPSAAPPRGPASRRPTTTRWATPTTRAASCSAKTTPEPYAGAAPPAVTRRHEALCRSRPMSATRATRTRGCARLPRPAAGSPTR